MYLNDLFNIYVNLGSANIQWSTCASKNWKYYKNIKGYKKTTNIKKAPPPKKNKSLHFKNMKLVH